MNGAKRISSIRLLLFGEAVVFLMAAFVHAGMGIDVYRHRDCHACHSQKGARRTHSAVRCVRSTNNRRRVVIKGLIFMEEQ